MTRDPSHVTCDTWWGVNTLSKFQLPSYTGSVKDILGKSDERTWVSEFAIFAQKLSKIVARKNLIFCFFATHCRWVQVQISCSILPCIVGDLAGGGSVTVAVGVSDM